MIEKMNTNYLKTSFLGLDISCPITSASGTFGYGECYQQYFDIQELGMLTTKGITLLPQSGNPQIRLAEVESGLINSIGLENPGYDYFANVIAKSFRNYQIPIIANINGKTIEEYALLAGKVNELAEIDFVELNISCPNVKEGGILFGTNHEITRNVVRTVREKLTNKKLIVKLSPSVTNIKEFAIICEQEGADALSLINTIPAMKIDIKTQKPVIGNKIGGLSGNCIKPIAVRMVYEVYSSVNIPIIGMGGISSAADALEFFMAGASVIAIGTGMFVNPYLILQIKSDLNKYCLENNINNIKEIIGIAHR